jgi:hypothetical protein
MCWLAAEENGFSPTGLKVSSAFGPGTTPVTETEAGIIQLLL